VLVDSTYQVPGVGPVVAGNVVRGRVRVGETMLLGPNAAGAFVPVLIRSIQIRYTPIEEAPFGSTAAFAIRIKSKGDHKKVRAWLADDARVRLIVITMLLGCGRCWYRA
jgi:GTPase